ncbi:MAG: DUF3830 family protein [Candidatus Bathyarchaeia archaeon]|jgi:hypothetical protein
MARKIILDLEGETATATMLEKFAPLTCEAVWNILPVEGRAIHANWSGREIMLHLEGEKLLRIPSERRLRSHFVAPGDIVYYWRDAQLSRGKQLAYSSQFQRELSEFAIFYGDPCGEGLEADDPSRQLRQVSLTSHTKFASLDKPIPEGFLKKCEANRHEGLKRLVVSRFEK